MIEATLALSRSLGSIDSTVDSTTDKALQGLLVLRKGFSFGELMGSLWGVHVYARDFGKNEIALARYLRGVGFKLCNVPRKSCSLESEVGFKFEMFVAHWLGYVTNHPILEGSLPSNLLVWISGDEYRRDP